MTRKKLKARDKVSKKLLFMLFEQGKEPTDPEVKELDYKASTVHNYYSRWKPDKGEVSKAGNKLETPLPKGEAKGGVDETAKLKPSTVSEAEEEEPEEGKVPGRPNASLLCEMPCQKGNEGYQEYNYEEWQACDSGCMSRV